MNQPNALRALFWKDARLILPLLGIAILTTLLGHLFLLLVWRFFEVAPWTLGSWPIALWTTVPGLMAFGSAASLIGTEEDSGTLLWLRSLPVSWQTIAHAKMSVALIAFAVEWTFASALLGLTGLIGNPKQHSEWSAFLTWDNLLTITYLQVLLLVLGFVIAYRVRTPLIGLVLLLPCFVLSVAGLSWILEPLELLDESGIANGRSLVGILFLSGIVLLHYAAARRRLARSLPSTGDSRRQKLASSTYYQPPDFAGETKPSPSVALLWQQTRQTLPLATILVVGSSMLMIVFLADQLATRSSTSAFSIFASLAPVFVTLSACWMGALVFYPDNQHNRCQFFSDRGISPTQIWWTRLMPPLLGCLILTVVFFFVHLFPGGRRFAGTWQNAWQWLSMLVVLFALGQLISQGIRRPVLAFLAAPAYGSLTLMPVFYFANGMGSGFPPILSMVPVLLFASWKLAPQWLENNGNLRYAAGLLGYTALAVAVPCMLFLAGNVMRLALRPF